MFWLGCKRRARFSGLQAATARRLISFTLAAVLFLNAYPAVAVAAGPSANDLLSVSNYGYTDEGITVSTLAEDLGASPRVTMALAAAVDTWSIGNGFQKFTASQLANVASGVKTYLEQKGKWNSFSDYVGGLSEIAGQVFFDMSPWWDSLGVSSVAEHRAFYHPNFKSRIVDLPWSSETFNYSSRSQYMNPSTVYYYDGAKWSVLPSDARSFLGEMMLREYAPVQIGHPSGQYLDLALSGSTNVYYGRDVVRFSWTSGPTPVYGQCMVCLEDGAGPAGSIASFYYPEDRFLFRYQKVAINPDQYGICISTDFASLLFHMAQHDIPSESAAVVEGLVGAGLPGWIALSGNALMAPVNTSLAMADAWGVPRVVPPGAIHDAVDSLGWVSPALSSRGDQLASIASSMTAEGANILELGVGNMLGGLGDIVRWLGDLGLTMRNWFVPQPGYLSYVMNRAKSQLPSNNVFGVITRLRDEWM